MIQQNSSGATDALKRARIRTLNEIAFIASDRAHGGPVREAEVDELRQVLRKLDEQIAATAQLP
jgi:hypothetical protein